MAQTLAQFKSMVSASINRGTTLDQFIPYGIQHAIETIEQNNTLKYMERFASFQADPNLAEPRALALPNEFVKAIDFVRFVEPDANAAGADFHYVKQIDPRDSKYWDEGVPDNYWIDGMSYLWFDRAPAEELEGEISYILKTDYTSLVDADNHWLVSNANGLLLAQTMIQMAPWMRNKETLQFYKELRGEAMKTLLLADAEFRQANRSEVMNYGVNYGAR